MVRKVHLFRILLICQLFVLLTLFPSILSSGSDDSSGSKIILLGTGTPIADPDRAGPSVLIIVRNTPYLVDFGPGVVRRAAAAFDSVTGGLEVGDLKTVFLTHLHSDHTTGYPDLIFTPWVLGRDEPLQVYGPKGSRAMTDHIIEAYREDIAMRLYGLEPANNEGYRVTVHEIEPGAVFTDSNVTVEAFPVNHGSWPTAFGYRFRTPDRTIVISGDTSPCGSIVEFAEDCDVLIHEVYSRAGFEKRSPVWQRYHSSFHTSTVELAGIAAKTKPGLLILYHQLFWGATEEDLLSEIRSSYEGPVVSGRDLAVY